MRVRTFAGAAVALLVACGTSGTRSVAPASSAAPPASEAPETTTTTTSTTTTATTVPPEPTVPQKRIVEQSYIAFGVSVDVTLYYPSTRVERVGFHESNNEGSQRTEPIETGIPATTMETRGRLSDSNSSSDVVVDPTSEIRAPVSGTVVSSGSYILYCDQRDFFVNIEPDDHPGWLVRMLHITDLYVGNGDRVVQGETLIAPSARPLPFESQVDRLREVDPAWPHVHMEVSDPSIPNVPNGGSGYENC